MYYCINFAGMQARITVMGLSWCSFMLLGAVFMLFPNVKNKLSGNHKSVYKIIKYLLLPRTTILFLENSRFVPLLRYVRYKNAIYVCFYLCINCCVFISTIWVSPIVLQVHVTSLKPMSEIRLLEKKTQVK